MTREFIFERATKNTFRYTEVVTTPDETIIGVVYVKKSAFSGQQPQRIKVTIEEVTA